MNAPFGKSAEEIIATRLTLLKNGYCRVPMVGKAPSMTGWQNRCKVAAEYEIRSWSRDYPDQINTGILGGLVVGVDIDVLIPELTERLIIKCTELLGHSRLRRVGHAPKTLFCYRVEAPIKKLSTPDLLIDDGSKHRVEILAEGQQFVAFGIHPETGQPYRWGEQTPLNTPLAELPLVTLEALEQFKVEAEQIIREAGGLTKRERDRGKGQERQEDMSWGDPPPRSESAASSASQDDPFGHKRAEIEDALNFLPNDFDYDGWIKIGMALYSGLGSGGQGLWERWSAKSGKNNPTITANKYRTFAGVRDVTIKTLFDEAYRAGWRGNRSQHREQNASSAGAGGQRATGYATETIDPDATEEPKQWLMKKLLAKREHSRWIAPPKMLKSALLASVANHLAAGKDFRGFKVKSPVGVLYCALERPGLTRRRLIAEQRLHGWSGLPIELCRVRFSLASEANAKTLIATINAAGDKLKHSIELVIIDTSAKLVSAHGGDEQQAKDNGLVWGFLSDVREATGVHTAVIGHTGKEVSRGERGSNASLGDADLVIKIEGDGCTKTASVSDANDLDIGKLFTFRGQKFVFGTDDDGDETSVYIVSPHTPDPDRPSTLDGDEPLRARPKDWPASLRLVKESIEEAIINAGMNHTIAGGGPVVRAAPLKEARVVHNRRYVSSGDGDREPAERNAWKRGFDRARQLGLTSGEHYHGTELVWLTK
jgi:AAA domain-containing protein/primase-like protein/bifunctional DNA primase/polymerase-like protein